MGRVIATGDDTVEITEDEEVKINGSKIVENDIFYDTPQYESDKAVSYTHLDVYKRQGTVRKADSYAKDLSDRNNYVQFADGIVRYNHDGVVFLNKKNEEKWIQPTQLQTPVIVVKDDVFAVADSGGNSILVFTKNGLKGEIQTTLPIERIAVSNQGIVSAILKDETSPKIISYDAAGNILVEQQITIGNTGYPIALDLSDDGKVLAVSYLYTKGKQVQSRIGYYNFDAAGKEKADNKVTADTYEDMLIGEIFFMGNDKMCIRDSPGIGNKSAQSLAFHVINMPVEQVEGLANAIVDARKNVRYCKECCTLTDKDICPICSNPDRDHKTIMVVETPRDLAAYEKTGKYNGVYHVLHGAISPMLGIGPGDIRLKELMERLQGDVDEVIIATNSSLEGETTAMYISKLIKPVGIKVSRIASCLLYTSK